MSTPPSIRFKVLAATGLLIGLVLLGVIGGAAAQTSHAAPVPTGIDFRRSETLAWSLELDQESPDALHNVHCTHVDADRYECVGDDASEKTRTLYIRVSHSGGSWQTIDDDRDH